MAVISNNSTSTVALPNAWRLTPSGAWHRVAMYVATALTAISQQMTFVEHLEELRRRILWAVVCVVVAFAACWIFAADLYDIASAPIRANPAVTLAVSRPQDIFGLYMKVTLVASIIAGPMIVLYASASVSHGSSGNDG